MPLGRVEVSLRNSPRTTPALLPPTAPTPGIVPVRLRPGARGGLCSTPTGTPWVIGLLGKPDQARSKEDVELLQWICASVREAFQPVAAREEWQAELLARQVWCIAWTERRMARSRTKPEYALKSIDTSFSSHPYPGFVEERGLRRASWQTEEDSTEPDCPSGLIKSAKSLRTAYRGIR